MITPREIQYLLSISKTKSIMESALECNVSQPALTIQLNKIEKTFGFKIFNRQRNNTTPTILGRKVIEKCEQIMKHLLDLEKIDKHDTEIKIGIIPTVSSYLLPKIADNLANSDIKVYFYDLKTEDLLNQLKNGMIDCGIVAYYPELVKLPNLLVKNLYSEDFVFVTHKSVDINVNEGINDDKIILLEEGNCMNISIQEICSSYEKTHRRQHSFSATSVEVIKAMIANNNGYGILPKFSIDQSSAEQYNIKEFKPKKKRDICLISYQELELGRILAI